MLDLKWVRENVDEFNELLMKRGIKVDSDEILSLEEDKRQLTTLIQQFQQAKNKKSKLLGTLKGKATREFEEMKRDVSHINEKLEELTAQLGKHDKLQEIMDYIPNLPFSTVPYGTDESMNKFIRSYKEPVEILNAKEHDKLGVDLGMMDFIQTAKISGSRFVTLKGDLAKLERALISFMIDIHNDEFDFVEISPPALVKNSAMYNVGQLPKFDEDSYVTKDGKLRLIPTGEVPLVNMVASSIIPREELPIRYVAYTECFRSEAGSAGKDTKGMIRNHQFGKVELVTICRPEESENEHEYMIKAAEEVLKKLELPYRVMLLCSGEMGFAARKTYDIEVWLPGQKQYREVSSISNCEDFQSRRMKARYKEHGEDTTRFVHTLNGSGLPIGRTIVAILENYQNEDGSITIPKILRPYMNGKEVIKS